MSTCVQNITTSMDSTDRKPNTRPELTMMTLPTELHIHIASYLDYPDALALKHTNRHFYAIVYTGVHLKVSWLLSRFERKLECPRNEDCSLRTDASFCNKTVRKMMERRRRHLECNSGDGGCNVVLGRSCRKEVVPRWLTKELRGWKGWRDEVLIYGMLFVFWTLAWHAIRILVLGRESQLLSAPLQALI